VLYTASKGINMFNGRKTQLNLTLKGYYTGKIDGIIGRMTLASLLLAAGMNKAPKVPLSPALGEALAKYLDPAGINTPLRVSHFLAQAACETWAFTTLKEKGGNAYFARYEMRKDLGNTSPGDGVKYCGRGLLNTTGKSNYIALNKMTGIDCVNHPELLEQPGNAVQSAVMYWASHNANRAADADDLSLVTRIINGGQNGLKDRQTFLDRLKGVIEL